MYVVIGAELDLSSLHVSMAVDEGDHEIHLPNLRVGPELLERVQFSVSSRNAESKVCETVAHLFGSPMVASPRAVHWKHISSGVVAMLRNKELIKKKYVWTLNMCVYNIVHGVLVWKGRVPLDCNYTLVEDNFHVFGLAEDNGIIGIMFQDSEIALKFHSTISDWITEGFRDDRGKASPAPPKVTFRKEMISYPCNFQHVQGSQAIDQCIEIERIKGQILASLANLKLQSATHLDSSSVSKPRGSKSKKKEPPRPTLPFREIEAPAATVDQTVQPPPPTATNGDVPSPPQQQYQFQPTPPLHHTHSGSNLPLHNNAGSDNNSQSGSSIILGRLSPLDLEDEINQSFSFSSPGFATIKEMSP